MSQLNRKESRARRHRRVRATVVGTPQRPRLNIFRSLAHIYAQVIDDHDRQHAGVGLDHRRRAAAADGRQEEV